MKQLLLTVCFLTIGTTAIFAQKYMTRTGKISFSATSPGSIEKIEGINNEVATILDAKSGALRFQVPIKSFKFQRELMQEHFNEDYMESDKYPKSDFAGTITNLNDINFTKDGTYNAQVSGKLTIHNVTHDVNVPGAITVKGNTVMLKAKFTITLHDYNVEVAAAVADKVSKEAKLTIEGELTQK